jgi:uncharacterized Zn finger protein (UPF0148 family)
MPHSHRFTRQQERAIADALRSGRAPTCPTCGHPLDRRSVPPRGDVSYVRDRVWLVCPGCGRTLVVDRREG